MSTPKSLTSDSDFYSLDHFIPKGGVLHSPPSLIEFVLEFLVAQLLSFTTFSSLMCCDDDHFFDSFVLWFWSYDVLLCRLGFLIVFRFLWSPSRLLILNSPYFDTSQSIPLVLNPFFSSRIPMAHPFSIYLHNLFMLFTTIP